MNCKKCGRELSDGFLFCPYCGTRQLPAQPSRKKRGNGQGTVYRRGDRYVAMVTLSYYKDESGRMKRYTRSASFRTKKEAVAALATLRENAPTAAAASVAQLWAAYSTSPSYTRLSASQQFKLRQAWERLRELYARPITSITIADIEAVLSSGASTYYTARDMKVVLSHLYDLAVKRELVSDNKAAHAEIPYEAPTAKRQCWTDEEVGAMWAAWTSGSEIAGYALLMCYTGMRFGEVAAMKLTDIHLEDLYMVGGEKTAAGRDRQIPISAAILPVLKSLMANRRTRLIEQNKDYFYERFRNFLADAGIRPLPMQTCRHYFFTALTAAGIQPGVIAETGGHASYQTTMANYVRTPLSAKLAAVNAIAVPSQSKTEIPPSSP